MIFYKYLSHPLGEYIMIVNPLLKYEIAINQCYAKYKTFIKDNSLPKITVKQMFRIENSPPMML